jgi:hypothetical protein
MRTLKLLNLHCNKTDDNNTKVDETFLTVDSGKFHGFGPESMKNGSDWNINANIQFNVEAIVSFFDDDLIRKLIPHILKLTLLRKMRLVKDQKRLVSHRIMQLTI